MRLIGTERRKVVPNISFNYRTATGHPRQYGEGVVFNALDKAEFARFNPGVLGLGDISRGGQYIQSLAAFFDLEGDTVRLWGSLPFYAKFLGDGILFLWETDQCRGLPGKVNVAQSLLAVTSTYTQRFLPDIRRAVSNPPGRLRCGIALGQIISIGGGADYVGSCINVASRLQKLGDLSFAISRRGFDLGESPDFEGSLRSYLTLKRTAIRSIGLNELVYIRKDEFTALSSSEKQDFSDP